MEHAMTDPVELKTERLLLRPFRLEDVDDVFEYAKDLDWGQYEREGSRGFTSQDAEQEVARAVLASWRTKPTFAIVLDSKVIGEVILGIDPDAKIAEISYGLGRLHWGKGLASEAAGSVIDWGFDEHGLAKIWALTDLDNKRSRRVLEKVAMTCEGAVRRARRGVDGWVDAVYYGLLREEWEAVDV